MKKVFILILILFFCSSLYFKLSYTLVWYNENNKITKSKLFILDWADKIYLYRDEYPTKNTELSNKFTWRQKKALDNKILLDYNLIVTDTLDSIIGFYSNLFWKPKTSVKNNEHFYYWIDKNSILIIHNFQNKIYLRLFDLRAEYYSPSASPDTTVVVCEYLTCNNIEGITKIYIKN